MEALKFETTVRENGILKISALREYQDQKVEVIIILKSKNKPLDKNIGLDDFFKQWSGYFPVIESDDLKYNQIMEKHR
jgi:hypothetical protein